VPISGSITHFTARKRIVFCAVVQRLQLNTKILHRSEIKAERFPFTLQVKKKPLLLGKHTVLFVNNSVQFLLNVRRLLLYVLKVKTNLLTNALNDYSKPRMRIKLLIPEKLFTFYVFKKFHPKTCKSEITRYLRTKTDLA